MQGVSTAPAAAASAKHWVDEIAPSSIVSLHGHSQKQWSEVSGANPHLGQRGEKEGATACTLVPGHILADSIVSRAHFSG